MAAYFSRSGGSPISPPGSVTYQSSNYQILSTDFYIGCTAGGITITLPVAAAVSAGQMYIIKDESGTALSSHITVNTGDGTNIDGNSSVSLYTNFMSLTILWTGHNSRWSVV
jgi:hypothetical protein